MPQEERSGNKRSDPKALRLALVADGHWNLEGNWTHVMHELLVKSLNELQDIDFVVFTGDSFNNNGPGYADAKQYQAMMRKVRHPQCYVLGNKESSPTPKGDPLNKKQFKKTFFPPKAEVHGYNWKMAKGDYVILGLDSSLDNSTSGTLSPATVDFVEAQLKAAPEKHHVLMMHHLLRPLRADDPKWLVKRNTIQNYLTVIPRICKYKNLKLWLCAHQHEKKVWKEGHVQVISAPGYVVPPHTYTLIEMQDGRVAEPQFVSLQGQAVDAVSGASAKARKFKHFNLEFNDDGFNMKEIRLPVKSQVRINLINNSSRDCTLVAKDFKISFPVEKGQRGHFEFTALKAGKFEYRSPEIKSTGHFVVK